MPATWRRGRGDGTGTLAFVEPERALQARDLVIRPISRTRGSSLIGTALGPVGGGAARMMASIVSIGPELTLSSFEGFLSAMMAEEGVQSKFLRGCDQAETPQCNGRRHSCQILRASEEAVTASPSRSSRLITSIDLRILWPSQTSLSTQPGCFP